MKCIAFNCATDIANSDARTIVIGSKRDDAPITRHVCELCYQKLTTGEGTAGTSILFHPRERKTLFEDVGHFHLKMGLPVEQYFAEGGTLTQDQVEQLNHLFVRIADSAHENELKYRTHFMFEELIEFVKGTAEQNILQQADALADLVWVALGTAHYLGVPFDRVWAEVRRANMAKRPWREGDPVKPRNASGLEVVKPEGWVPPNIDEAVFPTVKIQNGEE